MGIFDFLRSGNSGKTQNSHSITTLEGIGPKTAEALYDAGFETRSDLRNASEDELTSIDRLGTDLAKHLAKYTKISEDKRIVISRNTSSADYQVRFAESDTTKSENKNDDKSSDTPESENDDDKSKQGTKRREKEERSHFDQQQDPATDGEASELIEHPDVGEKFTAEVDRVSGSGNGIIETKKTHINIGPVTENIVGDEIIAVMEDNQSAQCLTENVRSDDTIGSDKQVDKQQPEFQQKASTIRSDLSEVESLISNAKLQKAAEYLSDVKSQVDSLEQESSKYDSEEVEQLQQLVNENRQELQHKKHQEEIQSVDSELSEIDSLISDTELQEADSRLDDIESQLDTLEQEYSDYESEKVKELRQSVREKRAELQRKKREEQIEEKIHSLRSDLYKIDSLITDAEYQEAENLVVEIKSEISSFKEQASQENTDTLGTKVRTLEQKCDERLSKSHVLAQLREMDPYEFERLVAKIWEKQGWDAQVTSGSADRGVDVIATKEDVFEERRHLIQVKRHGTNTRVGSEDIQRYAGLYARRDEKPDAVFVVTSNRFTTEAKEVAKNRDVRLVDCDELYEMLTET